jgi:hypothetical protein
VTLQACHPRRFAVPAPIRLRLALPPLLHASTAYKDSTAAAAALHQSSAPLGHTALQAHQVRHHALLVHGRPLLALLPLLPALPALQEIGALVAARSQHALSVPTLPRLAHPLRRPALLAPVRLTAILQACHPRRSVPPVLIPLRLALPRPPLVAIALLVHIVLVDQILSHVLPDLIPPPLARHPHRLASRALRSRIAPLLACPLLLRVRPVPTRLRRALLLPLPASHAQQDPIALAVRHLCFALPVPIRRAPDSALNHSAHPVLLVPIAVAALH